MLKNKPQKPKKNNLKLAGIFISAVLGLIFLSFILKIILVIQDSKFDGKHKFNILLNGANGNLIVSFSPENRTISTVSINSNILNKLEVPIDGYIREKGNVVSSGVSSALVKALLPLNVKIIKLTYFDIIRLAFFSRTINANSYYERNISTDLNDSQVNTVVSLTFTDPTIYKENQSIEIVNSTQVNGLGGRFATFVTNIGGNPILVTNADKEEKRSKIIYYGKESYTVKKLSSYFNLSKEQHPDGEKGISDVIIIVGNDLVKRNDF